MLTHKLTEDETIAVIAVLSAVIKTFEKDPNLRAASKELLAITKKMVKVLRV